MASGDSSTIIYNPETKGYFENSKAPSQPQTLDEMIPIVKPILAKAPESRNNAQLKILNKFSKRSLFFNAIVEHSSVDVAKNLLKYAQIHEIGKNRTLITKGTELENVIIFLKGRFGIIELSGQQQKDQPEQSYYYKKIIENSLKIARDLKRKTKQQAQSTQTTQFKTSKAAMYDIVVHKFIEQQEAVFNLPSLAQGKKYTQSAITCKNCTILTINTKIFYDILASFVRKLKSDKISAFRKFEYFNCIENQRLIQLVDELPLVTMKKGHFVYREGEDTKNIYLLLKGCIKITKTVDLFRENPNLFYLDREKIGGEKLPFADFSEIYNYKPRAKLLEIGISNEMSIFGEEELFSETKRREVNAQVSSQTAVFYTIDLEKLEASLPDLKGFMIDLKQGLFKNQTQKKISYRQQKLSQLLMCQTKNSMDYFFLDESPQTQAQPKLESPRKYKINKVNQIISPPKQEKPRERSIKDALYHTFNFNKFPLRVNQSPKQEVKNRSYVQFTTAESKIIELVHTMGARPNSSRQESYSPQKQKAKTSRRHGSQSRNTAIDIHNPLFDIGYFQRNQKEALRIEKESRLRPITTSQRSTIKPASSKKMSLSYVF